MSGDSKTISMSEIRAMWERTQADFVAKWSPTHDLDWCPLHGFWKFGLKMGGLIISTCPSCPSEELTKRLLRGEWPEQHHAEGRR